MKKKTSTGHCKDIIKFFNLAYQSYKNKKIKKNIKNCVTKIHSYSADKIKIKVPFHPNITCDIDRFDVIHTPLSFVLSNLDEKRFTQETPNDYAFKALQLILSMLEDYECLSNKKKNSKNIIGNLKAYKKIPNLMQFGIYRITIPKKIQLTFSVKGMDIATLKIKKLFKIKKNKK